MKKNRKIWYLIITSYILSVISFGLSFQNNFIAVAAIAAAALNVLNQDVNKVD